MLHKLLPALLLAALTAAVGARADDLARSIQSDYDAYLGELFDHFHRNPELPLAETETALRMATELAKLEFDVHEGVGGTGVVAIMENGSGPLVMMRADMDGLPVTEQTVDFLRVGRTLLVYQSSDGSRTGWFNPDTRAFEDLNDDRFRMEVKNGLAIARNEKAPDLVMLPVPAPEAE